MAYIRKLPSGKFQATVRHPSGRRLTKTDPVKRVVVAWGNETESALRNGVALADHGRKMTVGQWAVKWFRARNVEANTAAKNRSHWRNHIEPRWAEWPLQSIGRLDVQTWVMDMVKAGVGAPTVASAYHLFSGMLSDAVLEQYLGASPCREIDLPKVVKPEPRWLTRDEYDRIQLALSGTRRAPVWQAYVGLACFSGLRPGELAGLDVDSIDFDRAMVYVSQVVTREEGLRPYGKTDGSTRWVPFPPEVGQMLWSVVADRPAGAVFTTPEGGRVDDSNFRHRVWQPALEAAGVRYARPYVMRHTCASWLVQAGVPDREIMKMLGHGSGRLIAVYAHLAPDQHSRIRAAWGQSADDARRWFDARPGADAPSGR